MKINNLFFAKFIRKSRKRKIIFSIILAIWLVLVIILNVIPEPENQVHFKCEICPFVYLFVSILSFVFGLYLIKKDYIF